MTTSARPRVVLVVGASSGIGRETALGFARRGARLVLAARSHDALQSVADTCRQSGAGDVLVHATDIGDRGQVETLIDTAVNRFGHLDTIVQAAAVTVFGRFEQVPADVFDAVVRTDIVGTANVARSALVYLRGRGHGALVLVSSALGHATFPYQAPYVMSKFAVSALIRVLRQENRDVPGVMIHGIYPGPVDTPLYAAAGNFTGRRAQVPPPADDPAKIAAAIVRVGDERRHRDRSVGWANGPAVLAFRLFPSLFDVLVGPFVRATTFAKEVLEHTAGNVLAPAKPADIASPGSGGSTAAVDGRSRPESSRPPRGAR